LVPHFGSIFHSYAAVARDRAKARRVCHLDAAGTDARGEDERPGDERAARDLRVEEALMRLT
jgi:hypothetical protein